MSNQVELRDVEQADLDIFFEFQRDNVANYMAGFTAEDPEDKEAFIAHWQGILRVDRIIKRTILYDGLVVGNIEKYVMFDEPNLSYWVGRDYWGKGIATQALQLFLKIVTERPLYARAVKDNIGSIRVLEKCGFVISDEDKGFANARGAVVEEYILKLDD